MNYAEAINKRYNDLAGTDCCLSCGKAIQYASPRPGEVCVDIGSGKGLDAIRLAEAVGPSGYVYGIDIAEGMIRAAERNAMKLKVTQVKFIRSDLENIPLPAAVADLVISNCTLNHAMDKQAAWNEIYRILKPGGRFVVSDIYAIYPVPEEYRNDPEAVAECWAGAVTREEYFSILNNSGFKTLMILEESKPYPKGKTEVASITIAGHKTSGKCCCV